MLMPKRIKHSKHHRGRMARSDQGWHSVDFGEYGLKALEPAGSPTARSRPPVSHDPLHEAWRQGVDQRLPAQAVTKKPAETRMGGGKGSPEQWVAVVKPGKVMFELAGVSEPVAREAMRLASHKLPIQLQVRDPGGSLFEGQRDARAVRRRARRQLRDTREALFNLRFQHATGQLDNPHKLSVTRREIARLLTLPQERERTRDVESGGEA